MKKIVLTIFHLLLNVPLVTAQDEKTPPPPCSAEEFSQFDFWVGEWTATWSDTVQGSNSVTKPYDRCVILENFDAHPGGQLKGMSVSTYSIPHKKWKQTWVDNSGAYLDFEGGMVADSMILSRTAIGKEGNKFQQRMVWYNINHDAFDWSWQNSRDDGKTWKTAWQIRYTRK